MRDGKNAEPARKSADGEKTEPAIVVEIGAAAIRKSAQRRAARPFCRNDRNWKRSVVARLVDSL